MRILIRSFLVLAAIASPGLTAAEGRNPKSDPNTPAASNATFRFSDRATAMKQLEDKGGIAVILTGDGWYVGEAAYATSGVPFVAGTDSMKAYTNQMVASSHDKKDRKAEVLDRYGNVLVTLDGKHGDKELPALVAKSQDLLDRLQTEMRTRLAQGKAQAGKNAALAKKTLAPLAALKGWPEAEEARQLVGGL